MRLKSTRYYLTALFLNAFLLAPNLSSALKYDAVRDNNGNFVLDESGRCVRTKWETGADPCGTWVDKYTRIEEMLERLVYFDFDKYNLKSKEKEKLRVLARALREEDVTAVKIVGYTDIIGTEAYNYRLSQRRADSVKNYLDSLVRLDSSIVTVRALGKNNPIKICDASLKRDKLIACLAPNRRVEVEVDREAMAVESQIIEEED
jgi:OOP family OmpA-OmpF porin